VSEAGARSRYPERSVRGISGWESAAVIVSEATEVAEPKDPDLAPVTVQNRSFTAL